VTWEAAEYGPSARTVGGRTIAGMAGGGSADSGSADSGPAHVTAPVAATATTLPGWASLVRADNPGPMTLDGTNTWVLRAPDAVGSIVVDPGPLDEAHLRTVAGLGPVAGVLTTHGHPDHVEGLARFLQLTGAPLLKDAPGIRRVPTPGHTGDSVCFVVDLAGERAVLTGDTILGRGTTVVAHPDGDLGAYLDSLRLLAGLGPVPVLPGHGPALTDCAAAATFYLRHREARLDQVREVLAGGPHTPREIVEIVYAQVDPVLWPAAELSVRAQLAYVRSAGESVAENVRWDTP
jgi:glyoxylase-like metal-dependent hydrolase (beta-lactamase superfamily II)